MNEEQTKKVASAELVVTQRNGHRRTEFHGSNAAGDVIQVVSGVRAFTLAFLARRAGLKVREVRV